MLFIGFYD